MNRTVVLNVVGLTQRLVGAATPFLSDWCASGMSIPIRPVFPAVTCTAQATYLTGKPPSAHGVVANGWYERAQQRILVWEQADHFIQAPKIWDAARLLYDGFTCASIFWWNNVGSSTDYHVAVNPSGGGASPGSQLVFTQPPGLRETLHQECGPFPHCEFWGAATSSRSSEWIAGAAMVLEKLLRPTLSLVYLPFLDYNLQRYGPDIDALRDDLRTIDLLCEQVISFFRKRGVRVLILSEYGITFTKRHVLLNRILRDHGLLSVKRIQNTEMLDTEASEAFAVVDHQVAHVYIRNKTRTEEVSRLLASIAGVDAVLDHAGKKRLGVDHGRSGELLVVAQADTWFPYFYWLSDEHAPYLARVVAPRHKPGYDPLELFEVELPANAFGITHGVPLDPSLIRGSHGSLTQDEEDLPLLIAEHSNFLPATSLSATEVYEVILAHLTR